MLATLLLLSYTKLLRTVVTILSYAKLEYPDNEIHYVWLYDANVEFFNGEHIYLGIAGILTVILLIIPYTLVLTPFHQHYNIWGLSRFRPILDCYEGPYKSKILCRSWTGVLLVIRTLLMIVLFSFNITGSVDINLLIIVLVSLVLLMITTNGIYKRKIFNYLESFFYLQVGLFASGIAYAWNKSGNIAAVTDTSAGLVLIVFLAILGYHISVLVHSLRRKTYNVQDYAEGDNTVPNNESAPLLHTAG